MPGKPHALVIGSGLGGCMVASRLLATHRVTMVELPDGQSLAVTDTGHPAVTAPQIGSGLGGTTCYWHNGLVEIPPEVFAEYWPFRRGVLAPYYAHALRLLSDATPAILDVDETELRKRSTAIGLPADLIGSTLFYPHARRNAWFSLGLAGQVELVRGRATTLHPFENAIRSVTIDTPRGPRVLTADIFVLAAGGLSSPLLLQDLADQPRLSDTARTALAAAGKHYEDHPFAFVGEVSISGPLYKLWNYRCHEAAGSLRLRLSVRHEGVNIAFQLRPAAMYWTQHRREKIKSGLNDLRNQPLNPNHYLRLLTQWDDVLDILSFKLNLRLPTTRYSILMVAEQPPSPHRAISRGSDGTIHRHWSFPRPYLETLGGGIQELLRRLAPLASDPRLFPGWQSLLQSSAHHSGTARMASSPRDGVCDAHARVHGLDNLYVADGSVIPASGCANTGLTIAALALRLADHLQAASYPQTQGAARSAHSLTDQLNQ